jgi:hypothetical protein
MFGLTRASCQEMSELMEAHQEDAELIDVLEAELQRAQQDRADAEQSLASRARQLDSEIEHVRARADEADRRAADVRA